MSHSEGTGIAAFTTKSITQHGSPFTPPGRRSKGVLANYGRHSRGLNTIGSNVVLSTLGSIPPDVDLDIERDLAEMDDIRLGLGMDLGSLSTAIGGDDGEPLPEGELQGGSPAPAYHSVGRGHGPQPSDDEHGAYSVQGVRIDVEKATSLDV